MKREDKMKYDFMYVFAQTEKTYTFKDVTMIADNESYLRFYYISASDGRKKEVNFIKSNIYGWSVTLPC